MMPQDLARHRLMAGPAPKTGKPLAWTNRGLRSPRMSHVCGSRIGSCLRWALLVCPAPSVTCAFAPQSGQQAPLPACEGESRILHANPVQLFIDLLCHNLVRPLAASALDELPQLRALQGHPLCATIFGGNLCLQLFDFHTDLFAPGLSAHAHHTVQVESLALSGVPRTLPGTDPIGPWVLALGFHVDEARSLVLDFSLLLGSRGAVSELVRLLWSDKD
mmetsp:Transcript_138714/g.386826  ORF Transcript_138714/g.386826 Transcript_138714/m.386826 type:complete len:219 (+) Transcript_138714:54-710(+)